MSPASGTFGGDRNTIHLVAAAGVEDWPPLVEARGGRAPRRPHRRRFSPARRRNERRWRFRVEVLPHGGGLPLPAYATAGSAGADLVAAVEAPLVLPPGGRAVVPTGIALALPEGFEAQVRPRSGLALKHGVTVLNSPGTIDSDYRGEIRRASSPISAAEQRHHRARRAHRAAGGGAGARRSRGTQVASLPPSAARRAAASARPG